VAVSLAPSLAVTVSTPTASVYLGDSTAHGLGALDQSSLARAYFHRRSNAISQQAASKISTPHKKWNDT